MSYCAASSAPRSGVLEESEAIVISRGDAEDELVA